MTAAPVAAVLLAGGGLRQRDRDIATFPYLGSTLVQHLVSVLRTRCEPVFVIAAPGQPLPEVDAEVLRDQIRGEGLLLAAVRGIRAAADAGVSQVFVCTVGMPQLDATLIDTLVSYSKFIGADVVLPWDQRDRYLGALYRTSLLGKAEALIATGERGMAALVRDVDTQRIVVSGCRALTTVGRPLDLPRRVGRNEK